MFVDVEDVLKTELRYDLGMSPCTQLPAQLPTTPFVQLQRTGGTSVAGVADDAKVTVWVWGPTDGTRTDTAATTATVRQWFDALKGRRLNGAIVHRCTPDPESGLTTDIDEVTGRHRYRFGVIIRTGRIRGS